ncbi:hypothetical protein A2U01_0095842, partial [Trifolium medium]|nr:hypothetical protein [Trifolium medium]
TYNGLTDPGEHIENIDVLLNYRQLRGAIKCKLFQTTLRKGAMNWYKNLPPRSITSGRDLREQFTRHFTASRAQPKTEA